MMCRSVHLVRRMRDNEVFAHKEIKTEYMSEAEKRLAENEVTLLKVGSRVHPADRVVVCGC